MRANNTRDWVSAGLIVAGLALFAGGVLLSNNPLSLKAVILAPARLLRVRPGQILLLVAGLGLSFATSYLAGDGALMKNPRESILCYGMGIVMVTAGAWQEGSSLGKNARNALLWAAGLTLVAFPLRAYHVGSMPIVMNGDEGTFGLGGVEVAEGRLTNVFAAGPFSYPILSFWLISLPIRILGHTITAARIISVLAGTLTIGAVYLVARRMFDQTTALLAGLFLAVLHYHIQFSRLSVNNIWDGLFYVVVLGCLWSGWREEKRMYYVIGGLALGFSQFFYASSRVLVAVVVFYVIGLAIRDWPRFKRALPDMVLMGLVALVVFLPLGLFYLRHPNEFMAPMNRVSLSPQWFDVTSRDLGISKAALLWQQFKLNLLVYTDITFRTWYELSHPDAADHPVHFLLLRDRAAFPAQKIRSGLVDRQLAGMDHPDRHVEPGFPGGAEVPGRGPCGGLAGRIWSESLPGPVQPILARLEARLDGRVGPADGRDRLGGVSTLFPGLHPALFLRRKHTGGQYRGEIRAGQAGRDAGMHVCRAANGLQLDRFFALFDTRHHRQQLRFSLPPRTARLRRQAR